MSSAQFQVGANAGKSISFGINSAQTTALGNNNLTTNNDFGIESATFSQAAITTDTTAEADQLDSTIVGGEVSYNSSGGFNITSSIAAASGSLFNSAADGANVSTLQSINKIDITSVEGAEDAIKAIDGALMQIAMRGDLGAVQNRFESTIANLSARSRILNADIAQESSTMTKQNICNRLPSCPRQTRHHSLRCHCLGSSRLSP